MFVSFISAFDFGAILTAETLDLLNAFQDNFASIIVVI